ncbi:hypothetical protein Csa_015156 [Cucumis sativus]|uniref:Uncharacterized protein n=1 Tax=Cucumis sativus TaxID=3659 RepID=A0A0A0KW23_CUCSA|nr:hypothetical protein Csa_015156 [Cucumis sativus]
MSDNLSHQLPTRMTTFGDRLQCSLRQIPLATNFNDHLVTNCSDYFDNPVQRRSPSNIIMTTSNYQLSNSTNHLLAP